MGHGPKVIPKLPYKLHVVVVFKHLKRSTIIIILKRGQNIGLQAPIGIRNAQLKHGHHVQQITRRVLMCWVVMREKWSRMTSKLPYPVRKAWVRLAPARGRRQVAVACEGMRDINRARHRFRMWAVPYAHAGVRHRFSIDGGMEWMVHRPP